MSRRIAILFALVLLLTGCGPAATQEPVPGMSSPSPDGRLLASADALWDVESNQGLHTLERDRQVPGPVYGVRPVNQYKEKARVQTL